jgi:hypothetical protein
LKTGDRQLPTTSQPDVTVAGLATPHHPSLLTYLIMFALGSALIGVAQYLYSDWPGVLVNLGSSLISAVVLLILIDRRLRQSEIDALLGIPQRVGMALTFSLVWRRRKLYKFNLLQLRALEPLTGGKIILDSLEELVQQPGGFVLMGEPGTGKTTLLQMLCAHRSRAHKADYRAAIPIFYAASRWLPDRPTLDGAILEYLRGIVPISKRAFARSLNKEKVILIIDGADEIFRPGKFDRFSGEVARLSAAYPRVIWIVSSRPSHPNPIPSLPAIDVKRLTDSELEDLQSRLP